jgi:hypothetical protein
LPASVIAFADADAARAQLQDGRAFTALDDATAGGFRYAVKVTPLPEAEHSVAVGNVRHVRLSLLRGGKKAVAESDSVC